MINRIPASDISPTIWFGGEFVPVKTIPFESFKVEATVIRDGHDAFGADAVVLDAKGNEVSRAIMREIWPGSNRYQSWVQTNGLGQFTFHIETYDHPYLTWEHDGAIKIASNLDAELMCEIGALLYEETIKARPNSKALLSSLVTQLRDRKLAPANRFSQATTEEIRNYFRSEPLRKLVSKSESFPIRSERERALVGAWYEFFPRSEGAKQSADGKVISGTFKSAVKRLPAVKEMGFDVLYLPPVHPIGVQFRKGANNTLTPKADDPGVPWAIGSGTGGHDAINPELGTMKDFEEFVQAAKAMNIEIAMDFALQASPDHPWVKSNPEWFSHRPDGSIAYAENPPKKYQDIYPINFDQDFAGIVKETLRILRLWISKGINIFRVDNPHTKPVQFWQDVLATIYKESPEVIFLAEAFTKPAMMHALGKAGFQQSYTYFTWRTSKEELTDYGNEVAHHTSSFFRPNFWVNTPDILPYHLQSGKPAMFALRAVLAATLTPSWGMYAGFELYESKPLAEGKEEYLDSEKYQIKIRDWDGSAKKGLSLAPFIAKLNQIRHENIALQRLRNLYFHHTDSAAILAYSKREGQNLILVVVNLDPDNTQETTVHWNMDLLGFNAENFKVIDLMDEKTYDWSPHTFVRLQPSRPVGKVAHIVKVAL
ncbi:MAG: maltotransferase domain-containing protein [Candidatus Nanopelagicaceae bacterium]